MNQITNSTLHVRTSNNAKSQGILSFAHANIPCMLGSGGIRARKHEGDGVTPTGRYRLLYGFYRADRIGTIQTNLDMTPIKPDFGWCDDPKSPLYNRFITLPSRWRHEKLWREDNLYDICLVLNHNTHPRKQNSGSAIFFHLLHPKKTPTQGCVSISLNHMKNILRQCSHQPEFIIHA